MSQAAVIDVQGLTKRYGERTVVNDLSMQVQRGEIYGFLGPNGSGKSTLLKMAAKLLLPDEGKIVARDGGQELSKAAYRAHWEACMEHCPGPGIFEFRELHVVDAPDSAFAHWLAHCGGAGPDGEVKACWMRVTAGYQRINGQWKVVHEHWSAPFDMQSGTALFDLKP